jgi:hypothetical protein
VTPAEALAAVRRFGTVEAAGRRLKIRVPKGQLAGLEPALEVLRNAKTEVLSVLAKSSANTHLQQAEKPKPTDQERAAATALLNRAGCRIMRLDGGDAIGVWSDLDSPAIRNALHVLKAEELPIRYLDGPGVPLRYKLRRTAGEPVPTHIRLKMERHPEPWKVREQMLGPAWRPWPTTTPERSHPVDPATGIRPIAEWGAECGRGLVSTPRTRRKTTRQRRKPTAPRKRRAGA